MDATHSVVALSPAGVALTVAVPVVVFIFAMALRRRVSGSWFLRPSAVIAAILVAVAVGAMWFGIPAAVLAMALAQVGFVAYMLAASGHPAVAQS